MDRIGEKIYRLRKREGLSQEELGSRVGVTRQTVSKWETGTMCPESDKIKALSGVLGVSVDYFFFDVSPSPMAEEAVLASEGFSLQKEEELSPELFDREERGRGKVSLKTIFFTVVGSLAAALVLTVMVVCAIILISIGTNGADETVIDVFVNIDEKGNLWIVLAVSAVVFASLLAYLIVKLKKFLKK